MERKGVKAIFAVVALLVFLVGQRVAAQSTCYDQCLNECTFFAIPIFVCIERCTANCNGQPPAAKIDFHCSFACAKSPLGQLDPGEIKIIISIILPCVVLLIRLRTTCLWSIDYIGCISNYLWWLMTVGNDMGASYTCPKSCTKVRRSLWWRPTYI